MSVGTVYKIEKTSGGTDLTVTQCNLVGKQTPDCSVPQTGFALVKKEATANSLKVELTRELTGSGLREITKTQNDFIWSKTQNDVPEEHKATADRGVTRVDMSDDSGGNLTIEKNPWGDGSFMIHEHGHLLLWTIIADTLIIIGKYFKGFNRYFDIHTWTFFVLTFVNLLFSYQAPDDRRRRRILTEGSIYGSMRLSHKERLLAEALADDDLHETFASLTILMTFVITISGLILRFAIALDKRVKIIHFVRTLDLTFQRRLHTIFGILAWIFARMACMTGTSLHERTYDSGLLYLLLVVETVVAFLLFVLFEIMYRIKRKKWKVNFAVTPKKDSKEIQEILHRLRNKGNIYYFF